MQNLISRQAAIDAVKKHHRTHDNDLLELIALHGRCIRYGRRSQRRLKVGIIKAYHIAELLETPLTDLLEKALWKKYRIKELKAELEALEGSTE